MYRVAVVRSGVVIALAIDYFLADFDHIQLVGSNPAIEYFLLAVRCIEVPFTAAFLERDCEGSFRAYVQEYSSRAGATNRCIS